MYNIKMLRMRPMLDQSAMSRSFAYWLIGQGLWTKPVSLGGGRAVAWPAHEVSALIAARVAGKTNDEIRALVLKLEADRKAVSP
jgi:prophage regulatory protein